MKLKYLAAAFALAIAASGGALAQTKLKFAHAVSAIENPSRITKVRKEIARLNTEITKRKAASASEKQ